MVMRAIDGDVKQSQADNGQTHHSTRAESDLQSGVHALAGSIGSTGRGIGGGLHAEEAGQSGEETTGEECEGHPGVLYVQAIGHKSKEGTEHHEDNTNDLVLLLEVGHSTFAHIERNFFHTRRTFIGLHQLREEEVRHTQCHDRCDGHEPKYCRNHHTGFIIGL